MKIGMGLLTVLIVWAVTETMLWTGKLSEVLGEITNLMKGVQNSDSDALAAQVRSLAMEVRDLAMEVHQLSLQQTTLQNEKPGQSNALALILPAAAVSLGALVYGIMTWKGLSFSDVMYVTKRNMANALTNLTKRLENASDALAGTKNELIRRMESLDNKLSDQVEVSRLICSKVDVVRGDLSHTGVDSDEFKRMVIGLDCNESFFN